MTTANDNREPRNITWTCDRCGRRWVTAADNAIRVCMFCDGVGK